MTAKKRPLRKSLRELAAIIGGEVVGDDGIKVSGIAGLDEAGSDEISFLANPKYAKKLKDTKAAALIASSKDVDFERPLIVTPNPYLAFAKISTLFFVPPYQPRGVDKGAVIGKGTKLGEDLSIFPMVYIGEEVEIGNRVTIYPGVSVGDRCVIGNDSLIYSNVTIYHDTRIGERAIIHAGAVIGSDGYGFAKDGPRYVKIPQVGGVRIDEDVEIGANTTIDRATFGMTWIKRGVKTDNLVQIGHNVVIGEDTVIVSQAGISGSATIGDRVAIAGQVGIAGHIHVGDDVILGSRAGATKDVGPNQILSGVPAMPHKEWLKCQMSFAKLPQIRRRLAELEKRLMSLEERFSR
jgi:UDP-3-O-[3-hydroxymyristoyl] glucosamine N-acyltransferase